MAIQPARQTVMPLERWDNKTGPTRPSRDGPSLTQVLTGRRPFHHLWGYSPVAAAVLRYECPEKPLDSEGFGSSDTL